MSKPIFFDPTGRRGIWARRGVALLILAVVLAAIAFATTLVLTPRTLGMPLPFARRHGEAFAPRNDGLANHRRWLPRTSAPTPGSPLTIGFYVPDTAGGLSSLQQHMTGLDWVVPAFVTVVGQQVHAIDDPRLTQLMAATRHAPKVLPMVQNLTDENWDGAGAAKMLADPQARAALVAQLAGYAQAHHAAGLVMDYESLPAAAVARYPAFLAQLHAALPKGAILAVTAPAGDPDWRLADIARATDRVILMAYDEHWESGTPGPIASQPWFVDQVEQAIRQVGRDKLVVALGSYAYDWHDGGADALSIEEAWLAAHDSSAPVGFDRSSGNAGFTYDDERGSRHQVWMLDAATSWNELAALRRMGIDDVALSLIHI